jgi:hypothetical protein
MPDVYRATYVFRVTRKLAGSCSKRRTIKSVMSAYVHVGLCRDDQSLKLWLQHATSADVFHKDIRVCYINVIIDLREILKEKFNAGYFSI